MRRLSRASPSPLTSRLQRKRERVQRQERNKYGPGSISTADLVKEVDCFEDSDYVHEESPQPLSDKKPPASSTLTPGEEKALSMLQCDIFGARDEAEVKELESAWQHLGAGRRRKQTVQHPASRSAIIPGTCKIKTVKAHTHALTREAQTLLFVS